MKMFLTRLGFGSRMVVTGDITQIDLPVGSSGLQLVTRVLSEIDDIHFSRLTSADVVRHNLVGQIVDAYTKYDAERQAARFERENAHHGGNPDGANRAERRGNVPQDRQSPTRSDRRWGR
jgi:phosphate starvation-inducible PhoH-like protein